MSGGTPLAQSVAILLWMTLPVVAGYFLWKGVLRRRPEGDRETSTLARILSQVAILFLASPLSFLLFWVAHIPAGQALALPLVGLFVHAFGGTACRAIAHWGRKPPQAQGAFWLAGASSNVLTFGGIVTILLLRTTEDPHAEKALAELALYRIFEAPFYFLVVWPLAASISAAGRKPTFREAFRPVTLVPLLGVVAGWALNLAGLRR
ncbi:MAG TPA: hypothetical protein VEN81_08080, partial [Planctomycetota bacterium]|nr:hypothetical protein [Planctomycetota bacterium]